MSKCRHYRCTFGKRFVKKAPFIERYQRFAKKANRAMPIQSVKEKTFKEVATTLGISTSTNLRRFAQQTKEVLQPYSYVHLQARTDLIGISLGKAYMNILLDLAVT